MTHTVAFQLVFFAFLLFTALALVTYGLAELARRIPDRRRPTALPASDPRRRAAAAAVAAALAFHEQDVSTQASDEVQP